MTNNNPFDNQPNQGSNNGENNPFNNGSNPGDETTQWGANQNQPQGGQQYGAQQPQAGGYGQPGSQGGYGQPGANGQPGQNPFSQGGYGQPGQPGQPGQNPFAGGAASAYGQDLNSGGGGGGTGKVIGIIIALAVVIALAVGGYFLLAKDDEGSDSDETSTSQTEGAEENSEDNSEESAEETSEESSEESTSSETSSAPTSTAAKRGDVGGPDDSLPATYKDAMPEKVNDLVNKCKDGTFTLRYYDSSKEKRDMTGANCKGVRGSGWAYWDVDFINDKEYIDLKEKEFKDGGATIVNDKPNEYAGYVKDRGNTIVFIFNKDKDIVLESKLINPKRGEVKQVFDELGYSGVSEDA